MKFAAGIVLLVLGMAFIATPFYTEWQQRQEVQAIEKALDLIADPAADARDKLDSIEGLSFTEEQLNGILELEIPSIQLKQMVLEETTEKNLNIALTQIKEGQAPGTGNFTIAGHRGYRDGRHFSNLDQVQKGDELLLRTSEQTYVYRVETIEVINDTDVQVLEDTKGKKEITLITCTPSGMKRIAVKGELVAMK